MDPQPQPLPPDRRRAVIFTAASMVLTLAFARCPSPLQGDLWMFFICCAVVLLSVSRFHGRHPVPGLEFYLLIFPLLSIFFFRVVNPSARVASVDELLWVFDRAFGYPQIALTHLFVVAPILCLVCKLAYVGLPVLFVAAYLRLPAAVRPRYLAAIAACGLVILPFYVLCPAAGPAYLFGARYPNALPLVSAPQAHPLSRVCELNTTPSGHLAWALLLFWFARRYCGRRTAAIFAMIAVLILAATLGLGEHYVIDLVVAIPYTAAVWWLTGRRWARASAMLAVVALWATALRQGWALALPIPAIWILSAVTMAAPLLPLVRRQTAPGRFAPARADAVTVTSL